MPTPFTHQATPGPAAQAAPHAEPSARIRGACLQPERRIRYARRPAPPPEVHAHPELHRRRPIVTRPAARCRAPARRSIASLTSIAPYVIISIHLQQLREHPGDPEHRHREHRSPPREATVTFVVSKTAAAGRRRLWQASTRRPVLLMNEHQRQHESGTPRPPHGHPARSEPPRPGGRVAVTTRGTRARTATLSDLTGHRPATTSPQVFSRHQHAPDHLPGDNPEDSTAVYALRRSPARRRDLSLDHAHDLRHHRAAPAPMHEPCRDEQTRARREPSFQRGVALNTPHPGQEHPRAAGEVRRPRAGDHSSA